MVTRTYGQNGRNRLTGCLLLFSGLIFGVLGNYSILNHGNDSFNFNGGYSLNHFLAAAGLFLLFQNGSFLNLTAVTRLGEKTARLTYQAYFAHVLVMAEFEKLPLELRPQYYGIIEFSVTILGSFIIALLTKLLSAALRKIQT